MNETPSHFKGKDAVGHVIEAQAKGILSSTEVHGTEIPGHVSAAADAAREIAFFLLVFWIINPHFILLLIVSCGFIAWKGGRSAWLGWSRLERMHRVVEQERWEIQHHRQQERDELKEIYRAKGLEGKLLEDVMDVLMADEERLLRIMVEEELYLTLETHEHPLKQASGAVLGSLLASAIFLLCTFSPIAPWFAAFLIIAVSAWISATYEGNRRIPAIVWNIGIAGISIGIVYSFLDYL